MWTKIKFRIGKYLIEKIYLRTQEKEITKKIKKKRLIKSIFKLSLFAIIPSCLFFRRYKYYLKNDPKFIREYVMYILATFIILVLYFLFE